MVKKTIKRYSFKPIQSNHVSQRLFLANRLIKTPHCFKKISSFSALHLNIICNFVLKIRRDVEDIKKGLNCIKEMLV